MTDHAHGTGARRSSRSAIACGILVVTVVIAALLWLSTVPASAVMPRMINTPTIHLEIEGKLVRYDLSPKQRLRNVRIVIDGYVPPDSWLPTIVFRTGLADVPFVMLRNDELRALRLDPSSR